MPNDCGIIAFKAETAGNELVVDFGAAHSSASLAFAYWGPGMERPVSHIDRAIEKDDNKTVRQFGLRVRLRT